MGVGVWERRGTETARAGGMWWGAPEPNRASSPLLFKCRATPLLESPVSSPCNARWGPRGSRKGSWMDTVLPEMWAIWTKLHSWYGCRARMPDRPVPPSAVGQKVDKAAGEANTPRARTSEGSAYSRRTPPLTWTLPSRTLPLLHKPRSMTRTPDPLFILNTLAPLDTFILLFLFNKSLSEAWGHTHCICCLLFPPQYTLTKITNTTLLFLPPFFMNWTQRFRLFLCTQKAYFSQIFFTCLSKTVFVSTSPLPR